MCVRVLSSRTSARCADRNTHVCVFLCACVWFSCLFAPGVPMKLAPVAWKVGDWRWLSIHMEGAMSWRWGSFASRGRPERVRLPDTTQLLDAVLGPNMRRKAENAERDADNERPCEPPPPPPLAARFSASRAKYACPSALCFQSVMGSGLGLSGWLNPCMSSGGMSSSSRTVGKL